MPFDLFISYSRRDNLEGRITALKEHIEEGYREFASNELRCFFGLADIRGSEDLRIRT